MITVVQFMAIIINGVYGYLLERHWRAQDLRGRYRTKHACITASFTRPQPTTVYNTRTRGGSIVTLYGGNAPAFGAFLIRSHIRVASHHCVPAPITPRVTRSGISAASQGASPSASAWAMPKRGTFFAHSGLK